MAACINRIRLEFKVVRQDSQRGGRLVLIESDWNLKFFRLDNNKKQISVLIESDWNLKWHSGATDEVAGSDVLIESDWNLKIRVDRITQSRLEVLIESDWNLKAFRHCKGIRLRSGINRIRLEFKGIY